VIFENSPVIVWGRVQVPDMADENADSWDALELIIERVEPYPAERASLQHAPVDIPEPAARPVDVPAVAPKIEPPAAEPVTSFSKNSNGHAENGFGHANGNGNGHHAEPIDLQIDLERCSIRDLEELAHMLQQAAGEQEVRLRLREVGGQLRQLERSFFTTGSRVEELQRRFEFLQP
jgi:hypothetical protein